MDLTTNDPSYDVELIAFQYGRLKMPNLWVLQNTAQLNPLGKWAYSLKQCVITAFSNNPVEYDNYRVSNIVA